MGKPDKRIVSPYWPEAANREPEKPKRKTRTKVNTAKALADLTDPEKQALIAREQTESLVGKSPIGLSSLRAKIVAARAIAEGKNQGEAAKAAGVTRQTIYNWWKDDEAFKLELTNQLSYQKQVSMASAVATGLAGASELDKLIKKSKKETIRLGAAKAAYGGLVSLVKNAIDQEQEKRHTPLFQLPPGSAVSLDIVVPDAPSSPAPNLVVDALVGAHTLDGGVINNRGEIVEAEVVEKKDA